MFNRRLPTSSLHVPSGVLAKVSVTGDQMKLTAALYKILFGFEHLYIHIYNNVSQKTLT